MYSIIVLMKELFDSHNIIETVLNILISGVSGLVRYLDDERHGFIELFKALLFSVFCGFITLVFLKSDLVTINFTDNTIAVFVAISAFSAKTILKIMRIIIQKRLGRFI